MSQLPSLSSLGTVQLDYTSGNEKKPFWRIDGVNDLALLIFNDAIQHINVRFAEDK